MPKISGTRVDYGATAGKKVDSRTGGGKQPSGVSGATNAKVPVDGVLNDSREKTSQVAPATRKTTSGS